MRFMAGSALIVVAGCAVPLGGDARSAMYRAQIVQSGDLPCFALQDDAETKQYPSRVVMVHVAAPQSAAMARDGKVMWSLGLPASTPEVRLQGNECVVYGKDPVGADVIVAPQTLAFGVRYSISLNTDLLRRGKWENRQYSGDFCLSTQTGGGVRVHDLWLGDRASISKQDACFGLYRNVGTQN